MKRSTTRIKHGLVATFSIVAYDPQTGALGVAVASRVLAVGAIVPWAACDAGAIATQSRANTTFGPRGLEMLRGGQTARQTLEALLKEDEGRDDRQVGIVDTHGGVALWTGPKCQPWAGGVTGSTFTTQGNILAGPQVVDAMANAYRTTPGPLERRLMAALAAGEAAGGDTRGRQSAALLVVRAGHGYGGLDDRYIDLRVDDAPDPIPELQRLLELREGKKA
jgi:uncharacterized Ntn-hydrolase superfamily protein